MTGGVPSYSEKRRWLQLITVRDKLCVEHVKLGRLSRSGELTRRDGEAAPPLPARLLSEGVPLPRPRLVCGLRRALPLLAVLLGPCASGSKSGVQPPLKKRLRIAARSRSGGAASARMRSAD